MPRINFSPVSHEHFTASIHSNEKDNSFFVTRFGKYRHQLHFRFDVQVYIYIRAKKLFVASIYYTIYICTYTQIITISMLDNVKRF